MPTFRIILCPLLIATVSLSAGAATNSIDLTVKTTVTIGTCTAQLRDESNAATSTISFGEVNFSEIANKSKVKKFNITFSNCAGLPKSQATVQLKPLSQTNCDGIANNGRGFANALTDAGAASGVIAEVWTTDTPEGAGSLQLACGSTTLHLVNVVKGSNTVWPLSARLALTQGSTSGDLGAGGFSAPATFFITYQ